MLPPADADRNPVVIKIRQAFATRQLDEMQKEIDEMLRKSPQDFRGYFWQGFLDLQRRDNYNAIRALRRAEALNANEPVLKLLAVAYYAARQRRLFELTMKRALRQKPDDFAPYYYLGRYYVSVDAQDFAQAGLYFKEAIQRNPQYFRSYYYLGYCDEIARQLGKAEQNYRKAMALAQAENAKSALPYEGMARLRLLENEAAKALPYALHAARLAEDEAASHKTLAKVYGSLGRQMDAAQEWKRAAELDPTDASPYYHLFQIYSSLGSPAKAKSALANFNKLSAMYGAD
ncbi:MAG TPA: hypothetical protein VKW70_06650 [Terriglobia bacterium]|nr:hypothetical protein [Terriglobia bacterium]